MWVVLLGIKEVEACVRAVWYSHRFIAMVIGVHNIRMDHSPTTDISSARSVGTSSRCGCSLIYMIAWTRGLLR